MSNQNTRAKHVITRPGQAPFVGEGFGYGTSQKAAAPTNQTLTKDQIWGREEGSEERLDDVLAQLLNDQGLDMPTLMSKMSTVIHRRVREVGRFDAASDLAQDAMSKALTNLTVALKNGKRPDQLEGFAVVTARNAASAVASGASNTDRSGFVALEKKRRELEDILGRALTGDEIDELGTKIRNEWHDPAHKPSIDFWKINRQVDSLDVRMEIDPSAVEQSMGALDVDEAAVTIEAFQAEQYARDNIWGSTLLALDEMREVDTRTKGRMSDRRLIVYGAAAEKFGLPEVTYDTLSRGDYERITKQVAQAGGVLEVLSAYDEDVDSDEVDSFFAPFEGTGYRERGPERARSRRQLAEFFTENYAKFDDAGRLDPDMRERADGLWRSAVMMARRDTVERLRQMNPDAISRGRTPVGASR